MSRRSTNDAATSLSSRLSWRPGTATTRRLSALGIMVALAVALGGCNFSWPTFGESHGADAQGHDTAKLYSGMFIAGLVVAIFVWSLIFWCVVRYRRKNDTIPRQFQDHTRLEITYTIIPLIIVIVIFVFTVITENEVDSIAHKPTATVWVTAYQWGWRFQYEGTNGVVAQTAAGGSPHTLPSGYTAPVYPQLVIPVDETTKIILKSDDVIHDFYVHAFDFDRFAQPGVRNEFEFTPTRLGVYPGQCSEYCGLYHSEMLFSVAVVTPSYYRQWIRHAQANPGEEPKHITHGFDMSI